MDSAPHPEVPQAILDHIRLVISQTRILVAVTCGVYMWEWTTNLSKEYTFIWKTKISFLNVVFLLLRYYTFVALGIIAWVAFWEGDDMKQCEKMVLLLPYTPLFIFALANIIVIARVFAMWDKDKRVLALLCCLYAAQVIVQAYVPRNLKPLALPPGIHACGPAFLENAYLLYWVMIIVFDTTVLTLSLIKLGMLWRANGYMSNLVRILFSGEGKDFLSPVTAGVTSMAICRVVLNLRREAVKETTFTASGSRSRSKGSQLQAAVVTPTFPSNFPGSAAARNPYLHEHMVDANIDMEKQTPFDQLAEPQSEGRDSFQLQPISRK
ncbi:hypothetical protein P389DRAFT_73032 [Cystobasidium minutum MCA 4210]|uniref:uncharacterized protein n=1 Tax=Cystobasidium minutum MCA 4210 TaxID=1397322 RepID=UPI0034CD72E1|eukprot:jgi/Rhomi1/73032/CE73031_1197